MLHAEIQRKSEKRHDTYGLLCAFIIGTATVSEVTAEQIKWQNATFRCDIPGPADGRSATLAVRTVTNVSSDRLTTISWLRLPRI